MKHTYLYAGGKLLRESYGSNTLDFFYNTDGCPYAIKYNGTVYYYITNLQGDVMSIVDAQGEVVASYNYDPYGRIVASSGTLAKINPLRYRGYVYDDESGLYYLQSRYYDPQLGRFINADAFASTGQGVLGNNMFAYCCNNPVVFADSNGYRRIPFEPVCFDGLVGVSPIEEWEEKGVEYQSNGPGKGGKIVNSHLIRDDRDITQYIVTIMRDPRYKDDISGSFEGVYFEWIVHNALYDFGVLVNSESIKKKAADLDFGGTIYDDDHGIGSGLMWGFYMMALPGQAKQDLTTHLLN